MALMVPEAPRRLAGRQPNHRNFIVRCEWLANPGIRREQNTEGSGESFPRPDFLHVPDVGVPRLSGQAG
jgi:hypothetical protein